jgi:hypothetical protein
MRIVVANAAEPSLALQPKLKGWRLVVYEKRYGYGILYKKVITQPYPI